jgi:hypothetical protein
VCSKLILEVMRLGKKLTRTDMRSKIKLPLGEWVPDFSANMRLEEPSEFLMSATAPNT